MEPINVNFPVIVKNKIRTWKILNYTANDWCNEFKDKSLKFREGNKTYSEGPCWEHLCNIRNMTLNEFFESSRKETKNWLYFDYKYMKDVFKDNKSLMNDISWADLGLTGFTGEDSALWIGNEGAHTPCHMDTYGCNFVAQILGRKLWLLIPPEETICLNPVRVPYEESSVYSSYNFYTPSDSLLNIKKAYKVVLHPGDVLYIPRHWWHYVENLDVAVSVNVWIPLEEDHESRLEESLVQHYVSKICTELSEEESKQILNPNEYSLISNRCSLDLIQNCIENYIAFKCKKEKKDNLIEEIIKQLKGDLVNIELTDINAYVSEKKNLHTYNLSIKSRNKNVLNSKVLLAEKLINAFCHPDSVNLIKKSLSEEL